MSRLRFSVVSAAPAAATAAPAIVFRLRIECDGPARVHALALRAQIHIEPRGRRYDAGEQQRLYELFGPPAVWSRSLRSVTWLQASVVAPAFDRHIEIDLPVPCTYDLEVAAAKYLHAVRDGDVPLVFLFTGTAFGLRGGAMAAEPVPWDREADFRLPALVWRQAMDRFFPGGGWIRLDTATLDRLQALKGRQACVSWDALFDTLMARAAAEEPV